MNEQHINDDQDARGVPPSLRYRGPGAKKLVGPDMMRRVPPGIVATRSEQEEELDRRRTFGVIRNSL